MLSITATTEAIEHGHLRFLYGKFSLPFLFPNSAFAQAYSPKNRMLFSPTLSIYAICLLLSNRLMHETESMLLHSILQY
jgi:hypothetical protein